MHTTSSVSKHRWVPPPSTSIRVGERCHGAVASTPSSGAANTTGCHRANTTAASNATAAQPASM